jgi:putative peptidoglycan binding protein
MRRSWFVFFLCVATSTGALSTQARTGGQAPASGTTSNTPKPAVIHPAGTTAKKTTAVHKKHHTATKFVPRQKAPTADRISEIQSALAHGGYYQGDPNGKWDGNTIAALQKFQSANGLDSTGKLDAPSLQKLGLGSDIAGVSAPKPPVPNTTAPATAAPPSTVPNSGTGATTPATTAAINSSGGALANKSSQQ